MSRLKPARIVIEQRGLPSVPVPALRGGATGKGPYRAHARGFYEDTTIEEKIAELRERATELGYEVIGPIITK